MHSNRKIDKEDPSILDPIFRPIIFEDERPVVRMTTLLRTAWMQKEPGKEMNAESFWPWLQDLNHMDEDAVAANRIEDADHIDTPLRREIIQFWKIMHSDILCFLHSATPYCGNLDSLTALAVPFRAAGAVPDAAPLANHALESNILLLPTYMAPGCKVRITRNRKSEEGEKEAEIGVFDLDENPSEVYYLRRGFEYNFYVEGADPEEKREIAAVFSVCTLQIEEYDSEKEAEEDEGEKEEEEEEEDDDDDDGDDVEDEERAGEDEKKDV